MEIFKLFGSILVDDKEALDSLSKVDDKAGKTGTTFGSMIGTAAKWGAGIVAGAAAAGAGMFALASKVSDSASEINDMSVRTGLTTDRLQELKFAAEQSGVSFSSVQSAVSKMTMSMGKADEEGKGMALAFERLGVKTTDAGGAMLGTQTVFDQALVKLSEMDNATERNALGMEIFGKGFTELSPLVAGGSASLAEMSAKAHDLGLVLSEDAISAGDQFGDSLDAMKATLGGVVATIGVQLMPTFQGMMDWVMAHMPQIQAGIHTAFSVAGDVIGATIDGVKALTGFFQEHWGVIQPILAGIGAGAAVFGIYTIAINASAWATAAWTSVTGVATAAGTAFGVVLAFITSPIGLVVIAIGLLVAAGVLLYKNWDEVSAFLSESWTLISEQATEIFTAISTFMSELWETIKGAIETAWNGIKEFFGTLWGDISNKASEVFNGVATFFTTTWDGIETKIKEVWNGIKNFFSTTWNGIETLASDVFGGIATTLSGIWNGITGTVRSVWDGIVSIIKGAINGIIGRINNFINGINNIKITVPAVNIPLVGSVGGFSIGLPNIPNIPMLAEGGDIQEAGRVLVGERGPEFLDLPTGARVTPLDKDDGYKTADIRVYLDGREIVKAIGQPMVDLIRVKTGLKI